MVDAVTRQSAGAGEVAGVDEEPLTAHDGQVKVDQVIVPGLRAGDAVGRVADTAWRALGDDVTIVEAEALIAEDRVAIVASIAEGVGLGRLDGEVGRLVLCREQEVEPGTVRAVRAEPAQLSGVRVVVAVLTTDDGPGALKRHKARHIHPTALREEDRVSRGDGRQQFAPNISDRVALTNDAPIDGTGLSA